jgi:hypothetical protein
MFSEKVLLFKKCIFCKIISTQTELKWIRHISIELRHLFKLEKSLLKKVGNTVLHSIHFHPKHVHSYPENSIRPYDCKLKG